MPPPEETMQAFFQDLQERFLNLHTDIRKIIADLPDQALDWEPGAEMNSINILVTHLTGAERYWVGDVAMSEPSGRNRDAEFQAHGLTGTQLIDRLDAVDRYLSEAFERLAITDLEAARVSPRNNKPYTVGWSLLHALEHSSLHLGHLQIISQLWMKR
jgi:uncharacterized damage-inducible protein DinB